MHSWAKPAEAGERFVATLLVTDIVDSTKVAVRLGDAAWKELLARHNEGVRIQLDRFRGVEVHTTGDGSLPSSTGRHEPCGVRQRSVSTPSRMACGFAPVSIQVKSSATPATSAASRYTLSLVSQPWPVPVKYSFQRRRRACWKAPASN